MTRGNSENQEGQPQRIPSMNTPFIQVQDLEGNLVSIPTSQLQMRDNAKPQPDEFGGIPEFVNVSGRVQQFCVQGQRNDTIKVPPFGILQGEQWRALYATPTRAYPIPPLMERERNADKKFDSDYLLTVKQVLGYFEGNKELYGTTTWNPHYAPRHMRMFLKNAKIQEYDHLGVAKNDAYEIEEDRHDVSRLMRRWVDELEVEAKRRDKILTQG